jgi:SpoVK/Ycf46/Vps4 family AAA+-type ATPase
MIQSHLARDDDRFLAITDQIAKDAGKAGRGKFSEELQRIVDAARNARDLESKSSPVPISRPRGELVELLSATYPELSLGDVVLSEHLARNLRQLVREHQMRDELAAYGLQPRRKLLLSGPSGTGKTMTAAAIAGELSLPLFTVLLDGVITKFMGESAAKLRLIFDSMNTVRGVYFFDEVDALATARAQENDIGEARRMLNSFLQFIEGDKSNSLIIAATNHKSLLDPAIFRRFDAAFVYAKPSKTEARRVVRNNLLSVPQEDIDWEKVDEVANGLSQADLASGAVQAARLAVLDNGGRLTTGLLVSAIRDRHAIHC